jgi:stress-induced morphogen
MYYQLYFLQLANLTTALPIAERKYDASVRVDQLSIDSMSSDSDCGAEVEEPHKSSKIAWLVQHTFAQIQSLFYLSSLLRRPSFAGRYLRSVNPKDKRDPHNQDQSLIFCFGKSDFKHVCEKVRQWYGLGKNVASVSYEFEEPVYPDQIQAREDNHTGLSEDVLLLCQRLANANTRRLEQFQYWVEHSDMPMREISMHEVKLASESKKQASTIKPPSQHQNNDSRSSTSKQSFSTVVKSAVFETKTQSNRPRTVYAASAAQREQPSRVTDAPPPPKGISSFLCPYCGMKLDSHDMEDRQAWK